MNLKPGKHGKKAMSWRQAQVSGKMCEEWVRKSSVGQFLFFLKNFIYLALAAMAQWIEGRPVNQRVTSLIPSQGTCLGCRPGPQQGAQERQPHIDVSLPPALSKSNK